MSDLVDQADLEAVRGAPGQIQAMKDGLERLAAQGINAIED